MATPSCFEPSLLDSLPSHQWRPSAICQLDYVRLAERYDRTLPHERLVVVIINDEAEPIEPLGEHARVLDGQD
jgi:hypothetical protein